MVEIVADDLLAIVFEQVDGDCDQLRRVVATTPVALIGIWFSQRTLRVVVSLPQSNSVGSTRLESYIKLV